MTRTAWDAQTHPTEVDDAWNRSALDAVARAYGFPTWREFATNDLEVHEGRAGSRAVYDLVHLALAGVFPELERLRAVEAAASGASSPQAESYLSATIEVPPRRPG